MLHFYQLGSCRGDVFTHKGTIEEETLEEFLKVHKDDLEESMYALTDEDENVINCLFEPIYDYPKEMKTVLKNKKGYVCCEEFIVCIGESLKDAREQVLIAMECGDWA